MAYIIDPYKFAAAGGGIDNPDIIITNSMSGWSGTYTSLNDASDATQITTFSGNVTATINFEDTLITTETVTNVSVRVRINDDIGTSDQIQFNLNIGGSFRGLVTKTLTGSWTEHLLNAAGWNSAWTPAQLNAAYVTAKSIENDGDSNTWRISKMQMEVTFS